MSDVTRIVLLRHGVTQHSLDRRWAGRNEEPLVAEGRAMAGRAAARLGSLDVVALYSSPLRRAIETAAPLGAALGLDPVVEDALAECDFGTWDGLEFSEVVLGEAERFTAWFNGSAPAGERGESLGDIEARVGQWMDRVLERHRGHTVVAVSHAGPIKAALKRALESTWPVAYRMQQDHGSISVIEHAAEGWWVRSVNDCAHLHESLPPKGRRPFSGRSTESR